MRKLKFFSMIFLIMLINLSSLHAVCKKDLFRSFSILLHNINWKCLFPVRIAGYKIDPFKDKNRVDKNEVISTFQSSWAKYKDIAGNDVTKRDSGDRGVFCMCKGSGILGDKIGIKVSFWEPARIFEVVKDAWCFPFLGAALKSNLKGVNSNSMESKKILTKFAKDGTEYFQGSDFLKTFWQVHYYVFPILGLLEVFTDFICLEQSPLDLAYITEVDPRWTDDYLSAFLNPDALLFANPIAVMGCAPDAVAATIKSTIDTLYWCMGQWDTVFPLSGNITGTGELQTVASAMGKVIFQLHRNFVMLGTSGKLALCKYYPQPIWKKSQYRWQLIYPKKDKHCRVIGEPDFLWETNKNTPSLKSKNMDNFVIMLWRKRTCCAR